MSTVICVVIGQIKLVNFCSVKAFVSLLILVLTPIIPTLTDQSPTLSLVLVQLNNILQHALILISNQHPEKPKTGENLAFFTFQMYCAACKCLKLPSTSSNVSHLTPVMCFLFCNKLIF